MSEEFDESEIIFSDNFFPIRRREDVIEKENRPVNFRENSEGRIRNTSRLSKTTPLPSSPAAFSSSLPVNIPGRKYSEDEEYSEEDGGWRMVPPHLIVGRRIERGMAFSVCTGHGRTLKGRDLCRVRNSVLRLTGFLEA
ncbi:protein S40-1-like [Raphanus sativus]|uniref:Protein S40-1 n=1 Tax=Raphanus sativus TaxID=3726 RepID=A0A6J0KSQ1_RAPSA|nr:protein S40-1 [Raphanus sativus]XP_056848122.1 protein S40-1-like [Raphanus sativus]XP_056854735.1 protein S40-1-like [Raphanus sativus]